MSSTSNTVLFLNHVQNRRLVFEAVAESLLVVAPSPMYRFGQNAEDKPGWLTTESGTAF